VIATLVDWILSLHGAAAIAVVFLGPALESSAYVGFVVPGEIAVLLGGVLAYDGRIPLWAAIGAAVLGAIVGDSIGYWVGREYGRRILSTIGGRLPFVGARIDEHLDSAEAYVRRRGGSAVLFGRFTTALRVMVPGLAGMSGVRYRTFALFNVIGGVVWGTAFVLLGFVAGAAWERVAGIATWVGIALLALVVLVAVGGRVVRRWRDAERRGRGPLSSARRRWPGAVGWLERRFAPGPSGFALTLAVVGAGAAAWLFVAMTQDVLAHEEAVHLDPRVLRLVLDHRTNALTVGMRAVTVLGSRWTLVPLVLVGGGALRLRRRTWRPLVALAAALAGAPLLAAGFQQWVDRPRPPLALRLASVSGPGFPSVHATQAAAVYLMAAVVLTAPARIRARAVAGVVAALVILAVGVSRIYLGVHWFTDVVAGWALGAVWTLVLVAGALVRDAALAADRSRGSPEVRTRAL
jgi:membrane protein DedA with SNARE-associated domain/membrane-associated phospholipid phosphatase